MPPRPPIVIPRWIQLVGVPLLLLLVPAFAGSVRHAVVVFLAAALVALLLEPLARRVEAVPRAPIPRGLAVAVVCLGFAPVVAIAVVGLATVVVDRTTAAVERIGSYGTSEDGRTGALSQPPAAVVR